MQIMATFKINSFHDFHEIHDLHDIRDLHDFHDCVGFVIPKIRAYLSSELNGLVNSPALGFKPLR